jgi:hypothetical protein
MIIRTLSAPVAIAAILFASVFLMPAAQAVTKTMEKVYAEPDEEKALVYFIRTPSFVGSARTMFVYSDDQFLGALDNDSYIFAFVDPGERFLWLNWARINRNFEFEQGETYYFVVVDSILDVPEDEGTRRIEEARFYCQPTDKEIKTSAKHIRERSAKAEKFAEKDTGERAGAKSDREAHIAMWPVLDLSDYTTLVIEDFKVTDPKAGKRKNVDQLQAAPTRVANLVRANLDKGTFDEVLRGEIEEPLEGTLILRVELTQYKPGSRAARAMLAGAGAARLDFLARLIDGTTGKELATFSDERAYGWGGMMGTIGGIESIEKNLAYELAVYLERQVQGAKEE